MTTCEQQCGINTDLTTRMTVSSYNTTQATSRWLDTERIPSFIHRNKEARDI